MEVYGGSFRRTELAGMIPQAAALFPMVMPHRRPESLLLSTTLTLID
jgi:hypothetical protein